MLSIIYTLECILDTQRLQHSKRNPEVESLLRFPGWGCSEILPWSKLEVQKDSPVAGIPTPEAKFCHM